MIALGASICSFLAIVAAAAVVLRLARRRTPVEERLRALRASQDEAGARSPGTDLRRHHSSIPTLRRLLSKTAWADDVALQLQRANVHLRVGEFLLIRTLLSLAVFLLAFGISRFQPVGLVVAVMLGGLCFWVAPTYVNWLIRRRRTKIERQLVDVVPMLASSLRAGFAFQQAIEVTSHQIGPPLADELKLVMNDVTLGAALQSALQDLGRRVGSTDLDILITAILVQRTTGGSLSEILDKTADSMAERERIRGDILTFTAQQRLTGIVLSIYPVAIGLLLLALMPHLWSKLFTETIGQIMLGIAVGLQLIGFLAVRSVLNIEV